MLHTHTFHMSQVLSFAAYLMHFPTDKKHTENASEALVSLRLFISFSNQTLNVCNFLFQAHGKMGSIRRMFEPKISYDKNGNYGWRIISQEDLFWGAFVC